MTIEERARRTLRGVCLELPHLAGLAAVVSLVVSDRVPTAAVTFSGRILLNPGWFGNLSDDEARFVLAHELYHLCLRTHDRADVEDAQVWNEAHDYIINDILRADLGRDIPAGGLDWPGARHLSGERIVGLLRPHRQSSRSSCPESSDLPVPGGDSLRPPPRRAWAPMSDDVLTQAQERDWFPDDVLHSDMEVYRKGADALNLDRLRRVLRNAGATKFPSGEDLSVAPAVIEALRGAYAPPWEEALQRWLEETAPGPRSFARPSRRGERGDLVLPGRRREGWALHLVMANNVPAQTTVAQFLGMVGALCEAANVAVIHYLQCHGTEETERWVAPEDIARFNIHMCGCYGVSRPLERLAVDPEVEAVLVFHAGGIIYPDTSPPFHVLWVYAGHDDFDPGYGNILRLPAF